MYYWKEEQIWPRMEEQVSGIIAVDKNANNLKNIDKKLS